MVLEAGDNGIAIGSWDNDTSRTVYAGDGTSLERGNIAIGAGARAYGSISNIAIGRSTEATGGNSVKNGGKIKGAGTGVSDSILAYL